MKTHHAAVIGLLCCAGAAAAADADTIKVDLRLAGGPYAAGGCTGGDWSVRWKGELPSEGSSITDMLISYSAFDTTLEDGRVDAPAQINATPITCRDSEGKVTMQAHLAGGTGKIRGVIALKHDPVQHSPGFWFSVEDAGTCHTKVSGAPDMALPTIVELQPVLGSVLTPPLQLTRKDLAEGFENRYRIGGTLLAGPGVCMSSPLTSGELVLSYKRHSIDPSLTLDGCAALPVGQSTTVNAVVEPPGGVLRFWAEPAAALSTQSQARSALVTAVAPGKGTIKAEYTVDGRSASAELPAAGLKLDSINGGAPIPKLGLIDIDGKPNNKVYRVPYDLESADASDMVTFELANSALASVVNGRGSIGLQAVNEGRTTLQAKTRCGQTLGRAVEVEVVPCDDEVRAEATRRLDELKKSELAILRHIHEVLSSKEFDLAAGEIGDSTRELAIKTAELIAATLTGGEATAVQKGLRVGKDLEKIQYVQDVWDLRNAGNDQVSGNMPAAILTGLVVRIGKWQASMLKSFIEAGLAAEKFGQDLGTIVGVADEVEALIERHEAVLIERFRIESLLARCDKQPPPPAPPKPPERKPPPPKPRTPPPIDLPPTDTPPVNAPPGTTPPGTQQPPIVDPNLPQPPLLGARLCPRPVDQPSFTASELRDLALSAQAVRNGLRAAADTMSNGAALMAEVQAANGLSEPVRSQRLATFAAPIDGFLERFYRAGELVAAPQNRFDTCKFTLPAWLGTLRTRY